MAKCCASKGSFTMRVIFAAKSALSKSTFFSAFTGSTIYHFLPSVVSYIYQKRSDFFKKCGSTEVEKISLSTFLGENLAASA